MRERYKHSDRPHYIREPISAYTKKKRRHFAPNSRIKEGLRDIKCTGFSFASFPVSLLFSNDRAGAATVLALADTDVGSETDDTYGDEEDDTSLAAEVLIFFCPFWGSLSSTALRLACLLSVSTVAADIKMSFSICITHDKMQISHENYMHAPLF
jgi:hypothetical protein